MKIRFIYPRFKKFLEGHAELRDLIRDHYVGDYTMPPSLAIPLLAALTPPDIEVALTDDNVGQAIDYDEKLDCVAISCFTPQAQRAYEIADEYRKHGTRVVLGGIHPTGTPDEAVAHADAVCVGEAEPVWPIILDDLRNDRLKPRYHSNVDEFPLDKLPIPRRDIFSRELYKWDAHLVMASRGCPVKCAGCPIPNKEGTILRFRPVDRIIEEIRQMPYREFYFTDDTVMLPGKKSMNYLLSIMERTRELDVSIFLASTMMMVSNPEFYRKLRAGGATSMYTVFGFDRVSRQLFSPECTPAEWQYSVDLVRMNEDAGIHFFGSFGIGFDEQDAGTPDRILKFCHDAKIDLAEFYIHTPFPGTPFGFQTEQEGRILHRNYHLWNTGNVVFKPKNFSVDQLQNGFFHLWKEFYRTKDPKKTLRSFELNPT